MKTIKMLVGVMALTFVFAFAAFADCLPPAPGEMQAPPCPDAQITPADPTASAEPSGSTSSAPNVIKISVTTLDVLLSALSIF
jgi:hypothetical protein